MGYWILIGLIVCATGMVLVALDTLDRGRTATNPSAGSPHSSNWMSGFSNPRVQETTRATVVWTAFVPVLVGEPWPSRIPISGEPTQLVIQRLSSLTMSEIFAAVTADGRFASHGVISCQIGIDDILAGSDIDTFSDRLAAFLRHLESRGTIAVIGTVPDLSSSGLPASLGIAAKPMRDMTQAWNDVIVDHAHSHGAELVDLTAIASTAIHNDSAVDFARSPHAGYDQSDIAARFAPAIERAMHRASMTGHQP